nr:lipoyl synthase [bacterium]
WSAGTATFMILGDVCTRNCGFCAVHHGVPGPPDESEARRVRNAVEALGLKYAVITSVTRDDLPDGGAGQFAEVIRELRHHIPGIAIEVLIPDFQGDDRAIQTVIDADPDVLNHNIETVPELYAVVRPRADYHRSLALLKRGSDAMGETRTKSGLMIGMGETRQQLRQVLQDLRHAGVGRLTVGQYLRPTRDHLPVERYVPPAEFRSIGDEALGLGFTYVASGPLVRSSYHAAEMVPGDIARDSGHQ